MLERFKSLSSPKDETIIKVSLQNSSQIYGYLREVGVDYFVIDELKTARILHVSTQWPNTTFRLTTKKIGLTTLPLALVEFWSEMPLGSHIPYTET